MMPSCVPTRPSALQHHVDRRHQRHGGHQRRQDQVHEADLLAREDVAREDEGRRRAEDQVEHHRRERVERRIDQRPRNLPGGVRDHRPVGAFLQVGRPAAAPVKT